MEHIGIASYVDRATFRREFTGILQQFTSYLVPFVEHPDKSSTSGSFMVDTNSYLSFRSKFALSRQGRWSRMHSGSPPQIRSPLRVHARAQLKHSARHACDLFDRYVEFAAPARIGGRSSVPGFLQKGGLQ